MNNLSQAASRINSSLVVLKSIDYTEELYRLCFQKVKHGIVVLVLTLKTYNLNHLMTEMDMSRDELKNFIVIKLSKICDISKKLMYLHDWCMLPSLVIVDIADMLSCDKGTTSSLSFNPTVMQSLALCATAFLSYLRIVSNNKKLQKSNFEKSKVNGFFIVCATNEEYDGHFKLLKSLYFHQFDAIEDQQLLTKLLDKCSE